MKMTQEQIVQAILDKKSLDCLSKSSGTWTNWCTDGGWDHKRTPPTLLFDTLVLLPQYKDHEFRIRPEVVSYQTRDYMSLMAPEQVWKTNTWTSTMGLTQRQLEEVFGPASKFRWLEETQTKEYEAPE